MEDFKLRIEFQPVTNPKPITVAVFKDNRPIAFLTIEQIRAIVKEWDDMETNRGN